MTSYILPHEQEQAREMVASLMDCPLPEPLGHFIAVKLFVEESHVKKIAGRELIVPPSASCADLTRPHPALVIGKGNIVQDDYVLGDFIVIPRHEGVEMCWYGHCVRFLEGHKTYSTLRAPEYFSLMDWNLFKPEQTGEHRVSIQ
jgi:hypothetical protein